MVDVLATGDKYTNLFIGLAALWLLIVVLGAGIWYYRRRWWLSESQSADEPFTLADLRQLRDTGGMTEEEYQRVRAAMIGSVRGEPSNPKSAISPDPPEASDEAGF
jgi:hypothetical protein